jgi:ATP-dependent protease ClpP protease subunit
MAKEILAYKGIDTESTIEFVNSLEAAKDEEVVVRVNTSGGSPEDMLSMSAKLSEHTKRKVVKVDGKAYSSGFYFLVYADYSEALNVSKFMVHRAGYPDIVESNKAFMTPDRIAHMKSVNDTLREGLEAKIDVEAFTRITGHTLDDVFNSSPRLDVHLTAEQAKEIKLIDKVNTLTVSRKEELAAYCTPELAAFLDSELKEEPTQVNNKPNINKMTKSELMAAHPAIFAEYEAEVRNETYDQVQACMVYSHLDPETVKKAIDEKRSLTAAEKEQMTLDAQMSKQLNAAQEAVTPPVETPKAPTEEVSEEDKKLQALKDEFLA